MISISDIYDKDLNFLFGSGASSGLYPTLQLQIQKDAETRWSLEELATHLEAEGPSRRIPLFMHYYSSCIRPAQLLDLTLIPAIGPQRTVIENYRVFLKTVLNILQRRKSMERRCNLFTTNYDGCFPLVADELIQEGLFNFVLNDGSRGFRTKHLQIQNFSQYLCQSGVFDRHLVSIPQINLMNLHGSIYWKRTDRGIQVNYESEVGDSLLDEAKLAKLKPFSDVLENADSTLGDLATPGFTEAELDEFWDAYQKIPIVNPTKWKFHETVYEEHYYQMLRLLSYELEKPNAVLITFGFSFADEHILNLVKRSLSNPHLQVFVCCYSEASCQKLSDEFRSFKNVKCFTLEGESLDFSAFNSKVFTLASGDTATPIAPAPEPGPEEEALA
ncbi:hypothetical protein [Methylobacillus sp.]|uniref:hypothetical protein n=1 Tax=Methylobacillus sp. TaxID=56818 RepID=UPI002FE2BAD0